MNELQDDLQALCDPVQIKNAYLASSPYVLRKAFAAEPKIRRLVAAGERVLPLIDEELQRAESLDEITLAALAYLVHSIKAEVAPQMLGERFQASVDTPGPFFIHFAAHAIRAGLHLPIKPLKVVYSRAELIETQELLRERS